MFRKLSIPLKIQAVLAFVIISIVTLTFGLVSRGSFDKNWIEYNQVESNTFIGEHGYVIGRYQNQYTLKPDHTLMRFDLQLTMHEQLGPKFRVLLFIGEDCTSQPLIFGQWRTQLIIMQGCDFANQTKQVRMSTDVAEYLDMKTNISILIGRDQNKILVNNSIAISKVGEIYIAPDSNTTSLILIGNTPNGQYGWKGSISSLAISQESETTGLTSEIRNFQFNTFNENGEIHDASATSIPLTRPPIGRFLNPARLEYEPIAEIFKNQPNDAFINLVGFFPMGFVSALFFCSVFRLRFGTLLLTSVITTCIISLTIELAQVYVAGRKSHLHDVILNSLGGILGYVIFVGTAKFKRWHTTRKLGFTN